MNTRAVKQDAARAVLCILQMIIADLASIENMLVHASVGRADRATLQRKINDAIYAINNTVTSLQQFDTSPPELQTTAAGSEF